jgi:hypothetical protein
MALSPTLLACSAGVLLVLGSIHLLYTFHGPKLTPRDADLRAQMESVSPVLTRQTTMWKAWVGFNASHSLGAMLFGLVYGYLALAQPAMFFASAFLGWLGFVFLLAYLVLARAYWFRIPFVGVALSLACYVGAFVAARA